MDALGRKGKEEEALRCKGRYGNIKRAIAFTSDRFEEAVSRERESSFPGNTLEGKNTVRRYGQDRIDA